MLQASSIEENAHFPEGMNKFNYYITFVIGIHLNIFLPSINESRFLLIVAYPTILFIYMLYHYFCIVFSF